MKSLTTIVFTPEGAGHCLYGEVINLRRLGTLSMKRASHVEFNEHRQCWEVRSPDGCSVYYRSAFRQECLDWERRSLPLPV